MKTPKKTDQLLPCSCGLNVSEHRGREKHGARGVVDKAPFGVLRLVLELGVLLRKAGALDGRIARIAKDFTFFSLDDRLFCDITALGQHIGGFTIFRYLGIHRRHGAHVYVQGNLHGNFRDSL